MSKEEIVDKVNKPQKNIIKKYIGKVKLFVLALLKHEKVQLVTKQAKALIQEFKDYLNSKPQLKAFKDKVMAYSSTNKRLIITVVSVLVVVLVAGNIIFPLTPGKLNKTRLVRSDVYLVEKVDFVDTLPVMGLVRGGESVDIGFQVAGVVADVAYNEGKLIKKGDLVAALDSTDARLKVEYNESKVKAAEKRVEVHEQLFKLKNVIKAKLDEVRYEYESQLKELEFARRELEKTRLIAPVTGLLGPIEAEVGEMITPNTKLTSIYAVGYVYLDLGIIEKDIGKISLGQTINAKVDAYPDVKRTGEIVSISPVIEGKSRNFKVRAKISNNSADAMFLPGMFSRANVEVYSAKEALVIPMTAIKDNKVYVLEEGKAIAKEIKIGYRSYDYAEITSGLNAGDKIVAELEGDFTDEPKIEIINEIKYEK